MEAYATDGKLNSVGHGLAGEDRLRSFRWHSVLLQELVHVPDIFESMQKLTMLLDSAKA